MVASTRRSPFRPAPGRLPPHLAGRESEQQLFRDLLDDLRSRRPPESEVVLHGPRGNGKTTLLAWFEREVASTPGVEVVRLTPSDFRTTADLVASVRRRPWWRRLAPEELSLKGVRGTARRGATPSLRGAIRKRARKRPFAFLLDEAHTLDRESGRALLDAGQQVGTEQPFLLVLAGTPGLRAHLGTPGASFWNRAEKRAIGRLGPSQAEEALRRPLEAEGLTVTTDALTYMVRESHGYPYFLQLWGREVWKRSRGGSSTANRTISLAEVQDAQPEFERQRDDYYADRFRELEDSGLLPVGRSVAKAFRGQPRLSAENFDAVVRDGLAATSEGHGLGAARKALEHLGFIWREGGAQDWEPGIPSLMDYIAGPSDSRTP